MASSFFFYDLETSGISPRMARIMQFAGQRTDENLKPIGDPVNILIKLTPDTIPEPEAILLTGITPQKTLEEGITEAEFLKYFYDEVVKPNTIFLGFNTVRFDDEFMRFIHYRNFIDPYGWQWRDNCSRWDIIDLVRMTRALRPDGMEWPVDDQGKPVNKLEALTTANKIEHIGAHDALSDVNATIAVAKLIKDKQPDLFSYMLNLRSKKAVKELVNKREAFVYTSSHFPGEHLCTTAVIMLAPSPTPDAALIYDLSQDSSPFLNMSSDQLIEAWQYSEDPNKVRLPVKTLKYNRCPAIAPLGVIKDPKVQQRIGLDMKAIENNMSVLKDNQQTFAAKLIEVIKLMDERRDKEQPSQDINEMNVDEKLYDGEFFSQADSSLMQKARTSDPDELTQFIEKFSDNRLKLLLPLYKARNYPKSLDNSERLAWENFCRTKLTEGGQSSLLGNYFSKLEQLGRGDVNSNRQYLIEELLLYGQSIAPLDEESS
jgi:exodeoxyribonuclease-1